MCFVWLHFFSYIFDNYFFSVTKYKKHENSKNNDY